MWSLPEGVARIHMQHIWARGDHHAEELAPSFLTIVSFICLLGSRCSIQDGHSAPL